MRTRWAGIIRRLRWRARQVVGTALLFALSAALVLWARFTTGFNHELLLNIGASLVIVALSYAIFDPLFQELRRSRVEERPIFDHNEFAHHLTGAASVATVLATCCHLLEGPGRERFLTAVRVALTKTG